MPKFRADIFERALARRDEPPKKRWAEKNKNIEPKELDLVIVPAVALSSNGARLGNGAGYYDRLLAHVNKECILIGVGYKSQLFDEIQMDKKDVYMDVVLTEKKC